MSRKHTALVCTYKLNADEWIQINLTIGNDYPDALDQARATVAKLMHDQLADVLAQTRT